MATAEASVVKTKPSKRVKVKRTRGVGKHKYTQFVPHSKGKPLEDGEKRIILNIVSKLEEERPHELQKEIYKIASKYTGVSLSTVQNIKKEDKHKLIGVPKSKSKSSKVKRTRCRKKKQPDASEFGLKDGDGTTSTAAPTSSRQQLNNNNNGTCGVGGVNGIGNDPFGTSQLPMGLYHNHGGTCVQGTYYVSSLQTQ